MIKSIRSYLHARRLAKALVETQKNQYTNQIDAIRACNRLYRNTNEDYSVVKHQQHQLFWVVRTKLAKALAEEGHIILKAYKK
ncbi:hypothetical protein ACFPMF_00165 [Larkinella bovis]|uniref:Uncharacterized protein n=1 Tax=Larkinella bovis TaxID=683041 RepID=A0ABW0I4J2_9BACT